MAACSGNSATEPLDASPPACRNAWPIPPCSTTQARGKKSSEFWGSSACTGAPRSASPRPPSRDTAELGHKSNGKHKTRPIRSGLGRMSRMRMLVIVPECGATHIEVGPISTKCALTHLGHGLRRSHCLALPCGTWCAGPRQIVMRPAVSRASARTSCLSDFLPTWRRAAQHPMFHKVTRLTRRGRPTQSRSNPTRCFIKTNPNLSNSTQRLADPNPDLVEPDSHFVEFCQCFVEVDPQYLGSL